MESFSVKYIDWKPEDELLREAICTLGNGYIGTRGAGEETGSGKNHYPGTYLAGGYDRLETEINEHIIENEDLVNWPNWLCLTFRNKDEQWFDLEKNHIISFEQELDMKRGVLSRRIHFKDSQNRETLLVSERFVSMHNFHVAGICWHLTPLNWEGEIEVKSMIDGQVTNNGVARYRDLDGGHLEILETGQVGENAVFLKAQTKQSKIVMAIVSRLELFTGEVPIAIERESFHDSKRIGQVLRFSCKRMKPVIIEKVVSIYTSRDQAITEPVLEAKLENMRAPSIKKLLENHTESWGQIWNRCDINLTCCPREVSILRLHIFHILQTVSMNSVDLDVGVPARGLHGEAYRGHVFWDEIFIFPFLNFRMPELTRSLLMYRYRRLDKARYSAKVNGYSGAMYPWQSGSNGEEESQEFHLNPVSGEWDLDPTHLQRHINADIVYNIWKYYEATNDIEFLSMYGTEMALEIARFWSSIAQYNFKRERYEIHGVVGPDEFHTSYFGSDEVGINNNAYTNFMASWAMRKALEMFNLLDEERKIELMQKLDLNKEELLRWHRISQSFYIGFHNNLILQFEGYENLEEFDWNHYKEKYKDIQRLDRILKAEGNSTNRYKLNKQADVTMLFYLFSSEELVDGFKWLNYDFDPETISCNIEYYLNRSSNGSTLSRIVHAWVLSRMDRTRSWETFNQALISDVSDIQGGTTFEGIHLGAMAGTVDIIQRCYTGMEVLNDILWFNPRLPKELKELVMRVRFRGHWLLLKINHAELYLKADRSWLPCGKIGFKDKVYVFKQGSEFTFNLQDETNLSLS